MTVDPTTQTIPVTLPNGARLHVEAAVLSTPALESAGFPAANFDGVIAAIDRIATAVHAALKNASPTKASVEIGLELALESGQLTALLVKGSGKANLKITLQRG